MSKIGCKCGAVIFDQSDYLPYKAWVLGDANIYDTVESAGVKILKQLKFQNLSAEDIGSIIYAVLLDRSRELFQCLNCGRLYLKGDPKTDQFACFTPDQKNVAKWLYEARRKAD